MVGPISIGGLSKSADVIVTDALPGVYRASQLDALMLQFRGDTWKHMSFADAAEKSGVEQSQQQARQKIEEHLRNYERTVVTPENRALYDRAALLCRRYLQVVESAVLPLSRAGKTDEARAAYMQQADPIHGQLKQALGELVTPNQRVGEEDAVAAQAAASHGRTLTWLLLVAAIAGGSVIVYFSVRSVNRDLRRAVTDLSDGAEQVSSGAAQVGSAS